jgi:hypothetical protein
MYWVCLLITVTTSGKGSLLLSRIGESTDNFDFPRSLIQSTSTTRSRFTILPRNVEGVTIHNLCNPARGLIRRSCRQGDQEQHRQHKEGSGSSHGLIHLFVCYSRIPFMKNGLLILFSGQTT